MDDIQREVYERFCQDVKSGKKQCTPREEKLIELALFYKAEAEVTVERASVAVREGYDIGFRHFTEWNDFLDAESAILLRGKV